MTHNTGCANVILITVNDIVGSSWSNPVVVQNEEVAKRDFLTACSSKDTLIGQHPEDFKLFAIGDWLPSLEDGKIPVFRAYENFKFLMQGQKHAG